MRPVSLHSDREIYSDGSSLPKAKLRKNIQVGLYTNVRPNCTSGPLPTIRLVNPPANGTLTIRRGKANATN